MGIVYKLKAPNDLEYVGKTKKKLPERLTRHNTSANTGIDNCPLLCAAIREFGIESFESEILMECSNELLDANETKMIKKYNTLAPNGLNVMSGGQFGAAKSKFKFEEKQMPIDFDEETLPAAISKQQDTIIYIVRYTGREIKSFANGSEFDNLLRAISYYRFCEARSNGIQDLYLQNYMNGYCVKIPGYRPRHFVSTSKPKEDIFKDAKTYLEKVMFDPEEPELPGSIRTIRDGFRVKFPGTPDKHFVAEAKSNREKYAAAEKYLDDLRSNGIPEAEFPKIKGLQKYRNGFRVKIPGQELVRFENASKTKAELWQEAKDFIDRVS